jgi:hypothetical protein
MKTSTMRRSPLTIGLSMTAEVEKYMDGEIDALFSLTLLIRDAIPLTTIDYFFLKVCSIRWGAGFQGGSAAEVKFIVHIF